MKKYLVAYKCNRLNGVNSSIISVEDEYIPSSDNMLTLKQKLINEHHIEFDGEIQAHNGYVNIYEGDEIKTPNGVHIMAISNLDI